VASFRGGPKCGWGELQVGGARFQNFQVVWFLSIGFVHVDLLHTYCSHSQISAVSNFFKKNGEGDKCPLCTSFYAPVL
jgi:hypothetical protein